MKKQAEPGSTFVVDRDGNAQAVRVVALVKKYRAVVSFWKEREEVRSVVDAYRVRQAPAFSADLRPRLAAPRPVETEPVLTATLAETVGSARTAFALLGSSAPRSGR